RALHADHVEVVLGHVAVPAVVDRVQHGRVTGRSAHQQAGDVDLGRHPGVGAVAEVDAVREVAHRPLLGAAAVGGSMVDPVVVNGIQGVAGHLQVAPPGAAVLGDDGRPGGGRVRVREIDDPERAVLVDAVAGAGIVDRLPAAEGQGVALDLDRLGAAPPVVPVAVAPPPAPPSPG